MIWEKCEEDFKKFLIDYNVIGIFEKPIKLKSGRYSYFYVNWRTIAEDVYLLDKLTDYLISYTKYLKLDPDCFYGVPEGATKLAIITQFKWAKFHKNYKPGVFTLSMGRGKPKDHGEPKDRLFLGFPKGNVVVLEDVSTTGQSLINCIQELRNNNINILAIIALTNREEIREDGSYFEDILVKMGLTYYSMSNVTEILPLLNPQPDIAHQIEIYYKKYGIKEIAFR